MSELGSLSGEFTVGKEPELNYTPKGEPVCNVWVVNSASRRKEDGTWEDDPNRKLWVKLVFWKSDGAENTAESTRKGDRVAVVCQPYLEEYVDKQGAKRTIIAAKVKSFGLSTRFRSMPHSAGKQNPEPEQASPDPYARSHQNQQDDPPF